MRRRRYCLIAVINRLLVKEGMADQVVERFANGRGFVQDFLGFVSMEVLRYDGADEVLVITCWRDKDLHTALTSDRPLEAHLWPSVQLDAKTQHTFRLYRNDYTHNSPILRTHRCCASAPGSPRNLPRWNWY